MPAKYRSGLDWAVKRARRRTLEQALAKMTEIDEGQARRFALSAWAAWACWPARTYRAPLPPR